MSVWFLTLEDALEKIENWSRVPVEPAAPRPSEYTEAMEIS